MPSDELPTSAMTPSPAGASEPHPHDQPASKPATNQPAQSWYEIGRRVTGRTTDLLAIGIVVVVSLTMGRQILRWWHADAPHVMDLGPLDNSNAEWGAGSRPVTLEFGNSHISMTRQMVQGSNPQAALDAVRQVCQTSLVTASQPDSPPDQAELGQLETLSTLTPDMEQPGRWQLYRLGGAMPTIIGVKTFDGPTGNLDRASPSAVRRVICWGLVFPGLNKGTWTSYTFVRRQGAVATVSGFNLALLDLPPGCQRTVLMQESGQTGLLGFQGRMDPAAWQSHFDSWLGKQGWKQINPWTQAADGWAGRFVSQPAGAAAESAIQIQFHRQKNDQGVGLIHWLPGRESAAAESPSTSRGTP